MTDNRTIELREKLTERGIEYTTNDYMGVCETSWNGFTAMQLTPSAKLTMVLTPEQAIAATLSDRKLTAEQVRKCAQSVYMEGYSDGFVNRGSHIDETDWQAIADELNAELGSGMCEWVKGKCSNCGKDLPEDPYSDYEGNFCSSCGARVADTN